MQRWHDGLENAANAAGCPCGDAGGAVDGFGFGQEEGVDLPSTILWPRERRSRNVNHSYLGVGQPLPATEQLPMDDQDEPPGSRRHPRWRDVPDHQWNDWRWQMQNAIRHASQLAELLPLTHGDVVNLQDLEDKYKTSIPPYYFSLINLEDANDPIGLQSLPSPREMISQSGHEFEDPLEEDKDCPVPGLTHRYPDRALIVTTPVCSMYCRFCTRKRVTMDRDGWDAPSRDEERMIEYIQDHPEIHDVIVSGGDPLMLPFTKLNWFLTNLAAIAHVDVIRVGTRVPVTLPQKLFDMELVGLLAKTGKVWIQTHFNHPREITPEATRACRNLIHSGMPINNHSVLLRGVNDSVATMRELVRSLLRIKVRPYYLFHCDPVVGVGHLRTSVWRGMEIVEGLRGHMSGLGIPTYVVDGLHGAGKIPLMPNYLVSSSDNAVVLRNYEGILFRYAPEDKAGTVPEGIATVGVSNLLSGNGKALIPAGTPRMERRKERAQADECPPPDIHEPELVMLTPPAVNGDASPTIFSVEEHSPQNHHSSLATMHHALTGPGATLTNGSSDANGSRSSGEKHPKRQRSRKGKSA